MIHSENVLKQACRGLLYHLYRRKIFQFLLVVVIFFFIGRLLYKNWSQVADYKFTINYGYLLTSMIIMFANTALANCVWSLILGVLGEKLSYKKSIKIAAKTEIAKYIPGSIWNYVGRAYLCNQEGIPITKATLSFTIEIALFWATGSLISFFSLIFWWHPHIEKSIFMIVILVIQTSVIFLHPKVFVGLLNFILKHFKQPQITVKPKYSEILILGFFYASILISGGIAFYLFVNAFYSTNTNVPVMISIFLIAHVIGFIAVFAPNGLGIREGVLVGLLNFYMPLPIAIIISISHRIWYIIKEIIFYGITSLL